MTSSIPSLFRGSHAGDAIVHNITRAPAAVPSSIVTGIAATANKGPSWGKVVLVATALLGAGAIAAYAWYNSSRELPDLAERTSSQIATLPPPAPSRIEPPAAVPAEEIIDAQTLQTEQFTQAAIAFLSQDLFSERYSLQAYHRFIGEQQTTNYLIPVTTMHGIVSAEFVRMHREEIHGFVDRMRDHSTLDAEIAQIKEAADAAKAALEGREETLAGKSRFAGEIDTAWSKYFNAQKDFIRALAPLCRAMVGEAGSLSDHEAFMLDARLAEPNCADGKIELSALERGLKTLATGDPDISNESLLSTARGLTGLESYVRTLQSAIEAARAAGDAYVALDDERTRIAGRDINPMVEAAAPDSELAHVHDVVADATQRKTQLIQEKETKIAFIETLLDSAALAAAYGAVPRDERRL